MKYFHYALRLTPYALNSERGFVLIEFVIALPLILMLLYGLSQTMLTIFSTAKSQAADYVLEVEAQDVLSRITKDARAAFYVKREVTYTGQDIDTLVIKYHSIDDRDLRNIVDVTERRVFKVSKSYKLNAKRSNDSTFANPITGGNFFGDTLITSLRYSKLGERVMHIELEMESSATLKRIKLSTAVFMPACEEMVGF